MIYAKAEVKDGTLVVTSQKVIEQSTMTADCWMIQFEGLSACKKCEYKGTEECGGGETLKKMKGR